MIQKKGKSHTRIRFWIIACGLIFVFASTGYAHEGYKHVMDSCTAGSGLTECSAGGTARVYCTAENENNSLAMSAYRCDGTGSNAACSGGGGNCIGYPTTVCQTGKGCVETKTLTQKCADGFVATCTYEKIYYPFPNDPVCTPDCTGHMILQCTDSDNGINPLIAGESTGWYTKNKDIGLTYGSNKNNCGIHIGTYDANQYYTKYSDCCLDSTYGNGLNEAYCDSEGILQVIQKNCVNGCKEGACIRVCEDTTCNPNNNQQVCAEGSWTNCPTGQACTQGTCINVCSYAHPELCTTQTQCTSAGSYWCNGTQTCDMNMNSCPGYNTCHADFLWNCNSKQTCENINGHWCKGPANANYCSQTECPTCSTMYVETCTTRSECRNANGKWCLDGTNEYCTYPAANCAEPAVCGNNVCELGENPNNCANDCGFNGNQTTPSPNPQVPVPFVPGPQANIPVCGNNNCEANENITCNQDCMTIDSTNCLAEEELKEKENACKARGYIPQQKWMGNCKYVDCYVSNTCPTQEELNKETQKCENKKQGYYYYMDSFGCANTKCQIASAKTGAQACVKEMNTQGEYYYNCKREQEPEQEVQCPTRIELEELTQLCMQKNRMPVKEVGKNECTYIQCKEFQQENNPIICPVLSRIEKEAKRTDCQNQNGKLTETFDVNGCIIPQCILSKEATQTCSAIEPTMKALEQCAVHNGELIIKRDDQQCPIFIECITRNTEEITREEPTEILRPGEVLNLTMGLENIIIQMDQLERKAIAVRQYYESIQDGNAVNRFGRVVGMFHDVKTNLQEMKEILFENINRIDLNLLKEIKNRIQDIRERILADILYVMLSPKVEKNQITVQNCQADVDCFVQSLRICEKATLYKEQGNKTLQLEITERTEENTCKVSGTVQSNQNEQTITCLFDRYAFADLKQKNIENACGKETAKELAGIQSN